MKHEPRPAIHVEKLIGWVHKLGGTESLGISRVGQTVLARLMESASLPALWHCWGSVQKRDVAPAHISVWKKLFPSSHLDARHFSSSLYVTGAFQAATPVLELRGNESE